MSGENFDALERIIDRTIKEIEETDNTSPIVFHQEDLDTVDNLFSQILQSLRKMCSDSSMRPMESDLEEVRKDIFDQIQEITYNFEGVHSDDIPLDLYYLLKDFTEDLQLNQPIVINAGNSTDIFIEKLLNRYSVAGGVVPNLYTDIEDSQLRLIEFQRSELSDPENYPLLIHELFHVTDIWEEAVDELERIPTDIPENESEEVAVDLLSINYLGPVYGITASRMPNKIGDHQDWEHPSKDTRIKYLLDYIDYLNSETGGDSNIIDRRIRQEAREELSNDLDRGNIDYEISEFERVQQSLEETFERRDIPSYIKERPDLESYLGMPDAGDDQLQEMVNRLFLESEKNKEVALPVKPLLLLNLLCLIEESETSSLKQVYLSSFRKWYVRRKTRDETERDIIQVPEVKS